VGCGRGYELAVSLVDQVFQMSFVPIPRMLEREYDGGFVIPRRASSE
jgi:hypothetical protein